MVLSLCLCNTPQYVLYLSVLCYCNFAALFQIVSCMCFVLAVSPSVSTTNATIVAMVGQNVTLSISVGPAFPEVLANSIEWYKDDYISSIEASVRLVFGAHRRSLSIFLVVNDDAGIYTVKVRHPAGDVTVSISLEVDNGTLTELRILGEGEQNVTADSGEQLSFTCSAYGIPTPNIVWLKGLILITSDRAVVTTTDDFQSGYISSTLTITDLIAEDGATYFCRAKNMNGYVVRPFYLSVQQLDVCNSNPCQNNGRCVSGESSFECICEVNFIGPTCAIRMYLC